MRVTVTYDVPPDQESKRLERGLREGSKAAAEAWQRRFIRRHFSPGAASRYGYRRRSSKYQTRKRRKWGHGTPLVWSGETRRWVTSRFAPARSVKTAGGTQARLTILAPRYFFAFHKARNVQADKVAELTTTTAEEAAQLEAVMDARVRQVLAKTQRVRRRAR